MKGEAEFLGQPGHKRGVIIRIPAPETVVEMGHTHVKPQVLAEALQEMQEGYRIRPSGNGCQNPVVWGEETFLTHQGVDPPGQVRGRGRFKKGQDQGSTERQS